jgi:hypothetical protein
MRLITKAFSDQCLAFPQRVDQVLAEVTNVEEAKGMLDQAVAMQTYAEQLKAGVEIERPIALGVLKIKVKLGDPELKHAFAKVGRFLGTARKQLPLRETVVGKA